MASKEHEELAELMKQQINATDRATHAVRAIVVPSTTILITLLITLPIFLIGLFLGEDGLGYVLMGALLLLAGGILAINQQISETVLSAIPAIHADAAATPSPAVSSAPLADSSQPTGSAENPNSKICSFCGTSFRSGRPDCPECGMS